MKAWIYNRLYIFYTSVLLLYLVNYFIGNSTLAYMIGLLAVPMLLVSFIWASKLFKILCSLFIILGLVMYGMTGLPLLQLPLFLTSNMSMLAFLAVLPWINSVVYVGHYDRHLNALMKQDVDNLGSLYMRSITTTYTLMTFLNLSAINLAQNVLVENMKKVKVSVRNALISQTTVRAFALALIWSPMEIVVAITVDATGISYLTYLPYLLLTSAIVLGIDLVLGRRKYRQIAYSGESEDTEQYPLREIIQQALKMLFALLLFLITILLTSHFFKLNFILTVTLVIIPFSIAWSLAIRKWHEFKALGYKLWKEQTNGMQNFTLLFISLALFSNSLNETSILGVVQQPFLAFGEQPVIILTLILFTYFVMALIGVHPIATIGILLEVLTPLFATINPLSIGIVLIVAALATSSSASYGITVTMTSMNLNENPYKVTLRNLPFTFLLGGVGIVLGLLVLNF